MLISIEGSIGSGKSTTAQRLAQRLKWSVVLEETTKHPFLADFYTDTVQYAIETELGFILLHYHQVKALASDDDHVADFSQGKDVVFARMNLHGDNLRLFEHVYTALSGSLAKPDLAVFLDLPLEVLQHRIAGRGRPYELGVTAEYLVSLRSHYMDNLTELADRVEVLSLTGSESPDAVADQVFSVVRRMLFGEETLL